MARPKGSLNKSKKEFSKKAKELGIDPLEILLHFAANNWEQLGYTDRTETKYSPKGNPYEVDIISPEVRMSAAKAASSYFYHQLRAIEHSAEDGNKLLAPVIILPPEDKTKPQTG